MLAFVAQGVAANEFHHLNSRTVVLAADPNGDGGPCLQISRPLANTQQDRELGHDTYSLSTQTGATIYGGVQWYALRGSTLTMSVSEDVQEALGVPAEFSIRLAANADTVDRVRTALRAIIGEESRKS